MDSSSEDDVPLAARFKKANPAKDSDDEDDVPLARRIFSARARNPGAEQHASSSKDGSVAAAPASADSNASGRKRPAPASANGISKKSKVEVSSSDEESEEEDDEDEDEDVPIGKRFGGDSAKPGKKGVTKGKARSKKPRKGSVAEPKWTTLEHNGVLFPPPYSPHGVKMLYNGRPIDLTPEEEEIATMFAVMKDTDYATKPVFVKNFWEDWKKVLGPKHVIQKLELCDFTPIFDWHAAEKEKKKQMSAEEKKQLKEEKAKAEERYAWVLIDGVKEKVGNFRVEPPGLFRGRGEHPKMGKLKRRIFPEDIVLNIGKEAPVPECPLPGHKWKEVRHDNTVTWLAFWNDPINVKEFKYVFLHQSSSLKGKSDEEKYDKARKLTSKIDSIRESYTKDFKEKDVEARQIAVATYLIDRLALRAGNEKDDDEADTVGCCSLKVEHVSLSPPNSLEFDFLGKDSIRYQNSVVVNEEVYDAIHDFKKGKKEGVDLFDRLDTSKLNAHLKKYMQGLTAKVFRTYNASYTLETQLKETLGATLNEKTAEYSRANKEVAILCNHQRTVSKGHSAQMERLEAKIAELKTLREELATDLGKVKKGKPPVHSTAKRPPTAEQLEKKLAQTDARIAKMTLDLSVKEDLKTVALGTSKINYMDPRITVAWCKRHEIPIEKVFNKSLLAKFAWAMNVEPNFRFCEADGGADEDP
ncbi:DNA topoisomerase 1 alpha [Selaginella moellendorffii]|uniref:DNA topoisomerase 1 alpha n=1 Tax=Selaginella moellendorffii TaxID=88036 RepID=UPI000D1CEF10|nr:DNA topoisomerase 1 alpha [Selaginella moellendorffii]|eukprot:XP_024528843.1 DNA topoisomerase 1 alpha [Selaginella moellendorffii]